MSDILLIMNIKLKIQHFGSIKNGYAGDNGYLDMNKVTVITGPQASGKSTVAKLFSLFSWLEKALIRGEYSEDYVVKYNRFVKQFCAYHGLVNYFKKETYIDYWGLAYRMTYENEQFSVSSQQDKHEYMRPKVMYIPAARILISVLEDAENVKGLPESMGTLLSRYITACKRMNAEVMLPLKNMTFRYDKLNKIAWVDNGEQPLHLSETASGIQSLTPLYVVLDDLSRHLSEPTSNKSYKEKDIINKRVEELLKDSSLSPDTLKALLAQVTDVDNKCLISVIEEPEQNLFPSSQRDMLNSLLAINSAEGNRMLITTHSPFVINYLALAIKAAEVLKVVDNVEKLDKIVPTPAAIEGESVSVYELNDRGEIHDVRISDGILSDENILNRYLQENNEQFNNLLDIEEGE